MARAIECTLIDFCDEVHLAVLSAVLCFGLYVRAKEEDDNSVYYITIMLALAYLLDIVWRFARWRWSRLEQFLFNFIVGFSLGSLIFQKVIRRAQLDAEAEVSVGHAANQQSVETVRDLTDRLFVCCTVFRCAIELLRRYLRSGPSNLGSPKRCWNVTFRLESVKQKPVNAVREIERQSGLSQRFATSNWLAELLGFALSLTQFYGSSHMLIVCASFALLLCAVRVAPLFSLSAFVIFYAPVFSEGYLLAYLHDVQTDTEAFIYFVVVSLVRAALCNAPFPNVRFVTGSALNASSSRTRRYMSRASTGGAATCSAFELFLAAFSHRRRLNVAYCSLVLVPLLHIVFSGVYIHQHKAPIVVVPLLIVCVLCWLYVYAVVNRIFYATWNRLDDAIRWCSVMSLADSLVGREAQALQAVDERESASGELDVEVVTSLRNPQSPSLSGKNESTERDDARGKAAAGSASSWARKTQSAGVRISLDGEEEPTERDIRSLLAAKGVRYLGVIGLHLSIVLLAFYLAIALITYRTWNPLLVSLMLLSLPVQLFAISFFSELASNLGGTSIAYSAILPPNATTRMNELMSAIRDVERERQGGRLTRLIGALQRYFQYGMLHSVGCDYASSAMELPEFTGKLRRFFAARTPDGLAYDNYVLVFVGPSLPNGDWQFSDNQQLTFESLMKMWLEFNEASGSRLVLVVDSPNASRWHKQVCGTQRSFVALQTYQSASRTGPVPLGEFTESWLRLQMGRDEYDAARLDDYSTESYEIGQGRMRLLDDSSAARLEFEYAVSASWYFYRLRLPNAYEIVAYYFSGHSLPPPGNSCIKFDSKRAALLSMFLCVTLRGHRLVQLAYSSCDCCRSKWYRLCPPPSLTLDNGLQLLGRSAASQQTAASPRTARSF